MDVFPVSLMVSVDMKRGSILRIFRATPSAFRANEGRGCRQIYEQNTTKVRERYITCILVPHNSTELLVSFQINFTT